MEDYIWKSYNYKVLKGKWGISILLEAGYVSLNRNVSKNKIICLENGVYFNSILQPYPESQSLLPQELHCFCNGLKVVAKQILKSTPHLPNVLIALRSIQFSDCNIQDEAFTAAAMEWASEVFQFETPNYQVFFDDSKGTYGRYVFDFPCLVASNYEEDLNMEKLISKLSEIDFANLTIDEILDSRDNNPFDSEWVRVYNEIEKLKKEKEYTAEQETYNSDVREQVFKKIYKLSGHSALSGYISDDFGMITDSRILNYSDTWLNILISCYENSMVPSGSL